jgi:hypothetical protein
MNAMIDEILNAIAKHTRWSAEDLKQAHDVLESVDNVLLAVRLADKFNISLMEAFSFIDG